MLCSATALLGRTASATFAGRLFRLVAFLLFLGSIFLGVFLCFLVLLGVLLHIFRLFLGRCLLSNRGLVLGGAPGARSSASTALSSLSRNSQRRTSHQAGDTKPCYETLDLILIHSVTSFRRNVFTQRLILSIK